VTADAHERHVSSPEPTQVWRSASLPGVELTLGVNAGRRCRLLHESYAVCVVPYTGNENTVLSRWKYRGVEHHYRPGAIGIEEPGEVHTSLRVYSPIRYCMLRIAPELVEDAARELGLTRVHFPVALIGTPTLYEVFSRFYQSLAAPSTLLEQQTRLAALLRHLLTQSDQPVVATDSRVSRRAIERAREYLETHLAESVGLEDLSKVAGLSRFHLSRIFAHTYGLSPHAYQNQLRLRAIRERLRRGSRLDSIDAGFFDQSHMIRHFRDSMGMTPGEFAAPLAQLPALD
jgi:AraC-like DNA-binding protein